MESIAIGTLVVTAIAFLLGSVGSKSKGHFFGEAIGDGLKTAGSILFVICVILGFIWGVSMIASGLWDSL